MAIETFFCFISLVACSFKEKGMKPRNFEVAQLFVLGFFYYLKYPFFGVGIKCPVNLFIGQGAVYPSAHHHSTILKDFAIGFLSVFGFHLNRTLKNVLGAYSVNFPLHIFKIQPLITCVLSAHHSINCGW